jgi:hypothetical protein
MGYHSESKSWEEIREIFREVQSANVARVESFDKANWLDPELRVVKSPIIPFMLWTGRNSDEARAA